MSKKYPTTEHTFEALNNLKARKVFVSFNSIYEEVKRIRLTLGLKAEASNIKTRIKRSLVNTREISDIRKSEQSEKLSISNRYPGYIVKPENLILFNEKGKAKDKEIESNRFMLIKLNSDFSHHVK